MVADRAVFQVKYFQMWNTRMIDVPFETVKKAEINLTLCHKKLIISNFSFCSEFWKINLENLDYFAVVRKRQSVGWTKYQVLDSIFAEIK